MTNEDAFHVDNALGLYVVADGIGGHAAGEVASKEAIDSLCDMVKSGRPNVHPLGTPLLDAHASAACRLMESAVQAAAYQVFSMGELDKAKEGMGTTLSALLVLGDYAVMAHVGDSRIYRVRHGCVQAMTEDHTLIAWQLKEGLITPDEARISKQRNVVCRAVGTRDHVEVDTGLISLEAGDRFLLCSDGLYNYLHEGDVPLTLLFTAEHAADRFVELANERGGSDNITAVIIEVESE